MLNNHEQVKRLIYESLSILTDLHRDDAWRISELRLRAGALAHELDVAEGKA